MADDTAPAGGTVSQSAKPPSSIVAGPVLPQKRPAPQPPAGRAKPPPPKPAGPPPAPARKARLVGSLRLPCVVDVLRLQCSEAPIDSAIFRRTLAVERKVDALLEARRAEIWAAGVSEPQPPPRTLRLFVWASTQASAGSDVAWTLHVAGRLVAEPAASQVSVPPLTSTRLCALVRSLRLQLAAPAGGIAETISWRRDDAGLSSSGLVGPGPPGAADGWEVKRPAPPGVASGEVRGRLTLEMHHSPDRYLLPPAIAEQLGAVSLSRTACLKALYAAVKRAGGLCADSNTLVLSAPLSAALALPPTAERRTFESVASAALALLSPAPPLELDFCVPFGGSEAHQMWDVSVDLPDGRPTGAKEVLAKTATDEAIAELDAREGRLLGALGEARRKRGFLTALAASPAAFVSAVVATQARDVEARAAGVAPREAPRRGEFYRGAWVEDAVSAYLQSRGGHFVEETKE